MFTYTTKVRINLNTLQEICNELKENYLQIGNRDSHEGRSRFSSWNNIQKTYERIISNEIPHIDVELVDGKVRSVVVEMTASAKGNSARIYFKPSFTSLAMPFRKCIEPLTKGNVFVYSDIRAAEFIMNSIFAGEPSVIQAYQQDQDCYMALSHLFPAGTPRKVIKRALIANMYGMTPYTLANSLTEEGYETTEAQAERILAMVRRSVPNQERLKNKILGLAYRKQAYFCPNKFNQEDLVQVAQPKDGKINPFLAYSAYTQSALGLFMQDLTVKLLPRVQGTLISVFDSMFVEIKPESLERYKGWMSTMASPFKWDGFHIGQTMYDAQHSA